MKNEALDLGQIFRNNSDCYADTWTSERGFMEEGDVIQAMTEEQFIKVVNEILCEGKPDSDTSGGLHLANVAGSASKSDETIHYEALKYCCNNLLDEVAKGNTPRRQLAGLKLLLDR